MERKGLTQQVNVINKSADHFRIDVPQEAELSDVAPPLFLTEKVKYENGQNAGMVEIHHGQYPQDVCK